MEWKTPESPKVGQHRERLKFAWWPVECEDGQTRWLCKVRVLERLDDQFQHGRYSGWRWRTVKVYRAEIETRDSRAAD